ncbi:MAG: hypothetical protein ACTH1Z_07385 [Ancrocorticia sp.]|uniref:hypothetical protein n=1 Tax=Ancrocorticia sp. TaxID=2593684 RepID=UPI003F93D727
MDVKKLFPYIMVETVAVLAIVAGFLLGIPLVTIAGFILLIFAGLRIVYVVLTHVRHAAEEAASQTRLGPTANDPDKGPFHQGR